jgi:hypothetical protein
MDDYCPSAALYCYVRGWWKTAEDYFQTELLRSKMPAMLTEVRCKEQRITKSSLSHGKAERRTEAHGIASKLSESRSGHGFSL